MTDKDFAHILRKLRLSAGKTVPDTSAYLTERGWQALDKTVYSWEAARTRPPLRAFLDMCVFYGVTDVLAAFGYHIPEPSAEQPKHKIPKNIPSNDNDFAYILRNLRFSARKTVSDTAAYLRERGWKASDKTVYSWEVARNRPTPCVFLDMCEFYGVRDVLAVFGYRSSKMPKTATPQPPEKLPDKMPDTIPAEDANNNKPADHTGIANDTETSKEDALSLTEQILKHLIQLDERGQKKLLDYMEDLIASGRYAKHPNSLPEKRK